MSRADSNSHLHTDMAYFTNIRKKLYYWHLVIAFIIVKYLALTAIHYSQYLYISGGIPWNLLGLMDQATWDSARPKIFRILGILMYLTFMDSATSLIVVGLSLVTGSWNWFSKKYLTGPDKVISRSIVFYIIFKLFMGLVDSVGTTVVLGGSRPGQTLIWIIARPMLHSAVLYFLVSKKYNKWFFFGTVMLLNISYDVFLTQLLIPMTAPSELQRFPACPMLDRIVEACRRVNFPTARIYILGGLMNAFTIGLGKLGIMVIGDTLWNAVGDDRTMGVVLHEIGHWYHNHMLTRSLVSTVKIIMDGSIFWALITRPRFYQAFDIPLETGADGVAQLPYGIGLILTDVLLGEMWQMIRPVENMLIWAQEYQADDFSCKRGFAKMLFEALAKITGSDPSAICNLPFGLFYSTHPIFSRRLRNIAKYIR